MGLFDIDGKLMNFLGKLVNIMELGFLVIVCSLPLFTIGASVSACYSITLKMAKNEEGYVFKPFFKAFRANFKKATVLWLIMAFIASILIANFWAMTQVEMPNEIMIRGFMWFLCFLFIFSGNYIFPLQVLFENNIRTTIKNAFYLSFVHIIESTGAFLVTLIPIVLIYQALQWYPFIVWLSIPSVCYLNSIIFVRVFHKMDSNEEKIE